MITFLSRDDALHLSKKYGTPLHVLSRNRLVRNVRVFRSTLPEVELFYSVKANAHPEVLKILVDLGVNFDVASVYEYEILKKLGATNERMFYTHPIKSVDEIRYFFERGIDTFVADNEAELEKIASVTGGRGAKIVLRMLVENPIARINLSAKFGAHPDELVKLAFRTRELGMTVHGIAFHVGSQTVGAHPYVNALNEVKRVMDILISEGFSPSMVDIGGGFPIPYPEWVPPFQVFARPIREIVSEYFPKMKVIAEPGRFIIGNAVVLISSVIGRSKRAGVDWVFIDDSIYHTFSGKLYDDAEYPIVHFREKEPSRITVIGGRTCDSHDVLYQSVLLPEMKIGDIIVFLNVGAYTLASASKFNGFDPPKLIVYEDAVKR